MTMTDELTCPWCNIKVITTFEAVHEHLLDHHPDMLLDQLNAEPRDKTGPIL